MRRWLPLLLLAGCTVAPPPAPAPTPAPAPEPPRFGLTVEDEAQILRAEDRREFNPEMVSDWLHRVNPKYRARMALALARIGPSTFVDANGNGQRDPGEHQAGVDALAPLVKDPDAEVRATAAFALGQIGDVAAADSLLMFVRDADGDVAGEAVEAMSKLAPRLPLASYAPWTNDPRPGIAARAIRYLFRFKSDDAQAIAAGALDSPVPPIRQAAAYALSRRAYAPARERLTLLLNDPDTLTRSYAVRALGAIAAPESLAPLLHALLDNQPWVRTNALAGIARIAAKSPEALARPEMPRDVIRIVDLTDDPDPGTRASSIDPLAAYAVKSEVARERLLDVAANGTRWDRELAAGAIAKWLRDASLLPAELSDWAKVRVMEAGTNVSDALRTKYAADPSPMVRTYAINTIADDKVDANLALVRAAVDDADVIVRGYALDRYAHGHADDRLAVFTAAEERARKDKQDDARIAAIRGIAEVDAPTREATLRSFVADADPVVRRVVADLIEETLKKPRPQYTPLPIERPLSEYADIATWSHVPHTASLHMTRGTIRLSLQSEDAPMTTWNFARLANAHFFDGTTFMRVVPNFVIQGGDPRNDMEGGPGYAIRDEINQQHYTRGATGMALSGPDTGGSQFFIAHSPQPHLDGGYTIFARVVEGMSNVVDETERGDRVDRIVIDEK